jgi:hypothetical protein
MRRSQAPGKVPLVYIRLSAAVSGPDVPASLSFYLTVQLKQLGRLSPDRQEASGSQDTLQVAQCPFCQSRRHFSTSEKLAVDLTRRSRLNRSVF